MRKMTADRAGRTSPATLWVNQQRVVAALHLVLLVLWTQLATAQRLSQTINTGWLFAKAPGQDFASAEAPTSGWEPVNLPHTWNATDVLDDEPGYYRGVGWYKKALHVPADWQKRPVCLFFEGANQEAEVYVNGQLAGRHAGGYTAFRVPVGAALRFGPGATNEVLVKLTNRPNPAIPPLSADFTFYGGIYRDVRLETTAPVHFDLADHASDGVFVSTPAVSAAAAQVQVTGAVCNESERSRKVTVLTQVLDPSGRVVARQQTGLALKAGEQRPFRQQLPKLTAPRLWSPDAPNLYRVVSTISEGPQLLDEVTNPLGLRWFRFDADQGFFLNGQPLKLIGTNRHQDQPGLGNALPNALHERDVRLLKATGGNFLRVSHYPQDPAVLEACDRLGILASVEIPIVNAITPSEDFTQNCLTMQREMIRQGFNHPSVVIWAYMNEVLLRLPEGLRRDNEAGKAYLQQVNRLARQLEDLTRREDPGRATMLVNHGDWALYQQAGLPQIPMVVGWNLYQGWYSGELTGFAEFLDKHHRELPTQPVLITEYGADSDVRLHSFQPRRFDKTMEYANRYHQYYLEQILARPFVAGSTVWNLAEFNSETRQEAVPHVNNKSLLTGERQPKDTYYYYQAKLLQTPFLRIGSRGWTLRSGRAAGPDSLYCPQPVEVYTNQPAVRLLLNGRDLGTRRAEGGIARFRVPFAHGPNQLRAEAAGQPLSDQVDIDFRLLLTDLKSAALPFSELNVSLGDARTFADDQRQQVWLPEQEYQPGGWGYVGGQVYRLPGERLPYGSDRNILGTEYDAVYETQRVGLRQFRADVPDGEYEVTLHFAELEAVPAAEQLVYNLSASTAAGNSATAKPGRAFAVLLNGQPVLPELSAATGLQPLRAASFTFPVSARGGQGVIVDFKPLVGEAVLNGLQLRRRY